MVGEVARLTETLGLYYILPTAAKLAEAMGGIAGHA